MPDYECAIFLVTSGSCSMHGIVNYTAKSIPLVQPGNAFGVNECNKQTNKKSHNKNKSTKQSSQQKHHSEIAEKCIFQAT